MMKYHSASVLPNMTKLFEQCGIFYGQVLAETAQQQMTNERVSAQLQSLEKSRANKAVLLHELPPFTSKRTLDNNIYHFLQGAGEGGRRHRPPQPSGYIRVGRGPRGIP